MNDKDDSAEATDLVPNANQTLAARRSAALVVRGLRDIEVAEQGEIRLRRPFGETDEERTERILVVDDEQAIRDIIASMLTSAGYQCRAVAGGLEALALFESGERFELLLTDLLNLPLTGLDLLVRVKQNFPETQVVVASAVNDEDAIRACIRSGAYEYLVEPFERKQLLATVSRALEDRRIKLGNSQERQQSASPNRASIILDVGNWWTEPYYHCSGFDDMKIFDFVCDIQNISDREQRLGKKTIVFQRSKATGKMSFVAEAVLLESPPEITLPLQLAPQSTCDAVVLELVWPFPTEKPDDECLRQIFNDASQTLAHDDEFGTLIMFSRS